MGTVFSPVRREATREKVCAAIREAIVTGRLRIGERLPELRLTREFRVSRAVIREALQQLAYEGLVEQNINRGAQVIDLTPEQLDEILHLRVLLEEEAVRLARERILPQDAARILQLAEDVEIARSEIEKYVQADLAFHRAIWQCSGNQTLQKHLTLLTAPVFSMGIIMRHSKVMYNAAGAVAVHGADHLQLARAIVKGSPNEAMTAVRNHIAENWLRTRSAVERLHQHAGRRARTSR
jgi:DNA-binding GntR family transcriptional regulator